MVTSALVQRHRRLTGKQAVRTAEKQLHRERQQGEESGGKRMQAHPQVPHLATPSCT